MRGTIYEHPIIIYFMHIMLNKIMNCACAEKWGDVAPLVLRLALGVVFAWHGYDKVFVKGIPAITGFLGGLGFPLPTLFAYILSYGELIGGVLLIIGLCTHWVAKYCVIVGLVAMFAVHWSNGFAVGAGGYEYVMLITAVAISLMITGAGKYSVDVLCRKS